MPLERFQEYEFGGVPTASSGGGSGEGGAVTSVNGKDGAVVISKADIGLSQVDNTRDTDKPVSTATAKAIEEAVKNIPSGGGGGTSYDDTEVRQLINKNTVRLEDTYNTNEVDVLLQNVRPLPDNAVQYIPQILTEEQKAQARINLGIVSTSGGGGGGETPDPPVNPPVESTSITEWEFGNLSFSGGGSSSTTRARTKSYIDVSGFESISFPEGYKVSGRYYTEASIGTLTTYDSDWVTESPYNFTTKSQGVSYAKFVISLADDATISQEQLDTLNTGTVSLIPPQTASINLMSAEPVSSGGMTVNILPAPIDLARPMKANSSLHLKCAQEVNWDNMNSLATRYLYHDTDLNFYVADSPKAQKQWIFKWEHSISPSNYTMAFVNDGDLIAVYRTELEPTRLPDGAEPRQNPLFFKRSTGYTMSIINFGNTAPPSAWIANQGFQKVDRDNACYMVEYGRPSLYKSKMWKISGDPSIASNWRVMKEFDVSENASVGFKHCHTAQVDPYTGYTYLTTGDDNSAAAIYVTKDKGTTVDLVYGPNEKYCRLLNFIFTEDYVYWATDSGYNNRHSLFRVTRDENGVLDVANAEILHDFPFLGTSDYDAGVATYANIYLKSLNALVFLERVDSGSSIGGAPIYLWDIANGIMHTLDVLKPAYAGQSGFRCDYYDMFPSSNEFSVGFGYHASGSLITSNKNAVLDNRYLTSGLGNLIITISKAEDIYKISYDTAR